MKDITTNWTKKELKAYILLYCAFADFVENDYEKESILSIVDKDIYKKMHKEFDADNDFQRIQKIQYSLHALEYSKKNIAKLEEEIMELFLSDGKFDLLEKNMNRVIKRILNAD